MSTHKDKIYQSAHTGVARFQFDARVANVFSDMIARSVPGYLQILELLPTLVRKFRQDDAQYYDLGCSLGAGMLAMAQGLDTPSKLIGIDNSAAMLEQAEAIVAGLGETALGQHQPELRCEDLSDSSIDNAAMVLMNFTLQFIETDKRAPLLRKIFAGLRPNGVLVLSEKIEFEDSLTNQTLIDIHHQYKADQGYSKLEIAQKRDAIENVLIPETLAVHTQRLRSIGFEVVVPWVQNLQFVSILAIK